MFPIRSASIARAIVPRVGRAYATASTRPPIQLFGVDGTYASALYTASAKTQTLERTEKSLQTLKTLLQKDPKLETIISSPTLNAGDKSQIIAEITKPIASDKVVKNLLQVLAENNRLGLLRGVIDKYATLMGAHKGEVEAVITSAAQLDSKIVSRLEATISKSQYVGAGKKLKIVPKVNPEILGGLIVEIGERTIDLSVSAKMSRLNKLLTDAL
ncbi:F1 complex, OSCP/delta subunit of ATPase [Choiromyces venosus 120613-1]|uniref:ATP synthase subunit 5, mitochondrial n=1 Tax=Choiromyces venosus 120613-1 TaxID=1336337 RepID=A0A3N4JYX3_9PEZI|nr:F1 complex, OSCP/delta subunit of ATPase [Choiromyces venosus 120613-1]